MSSGLEKALEKAKYSALPLPRAKSEPTTIFSFFEGHLFIMRNAHSCLPDPPVETTPDPSVHTLAFTREFPQNPCYFGPPSGERSDRSNVAAMSMRMYATREFGSSAYRK